MKNRVASVKQKNRKKEAYVFIRRLYKVLREQDERVILKKLHGRDGYYDPSTEEIVIDYRKEFISTLIHEVLHHLHPPWSESKVIMKEREIMNTITVRQCKNIIVMLARFL